MNVDALSSQVLNTAYVPFGSSMDLPMNSALPGMEQGEGGLFAQLLKKQGNSESSVQGEGSIKSPIPGKEPIDKTDKLYELCLELETFLIKNLIKGMRNTVQKSNLIDTGFAGEVYEDMLYDEYAKAYAKNASFGLAEMAYRELAGK